MGNGEILETNGIQYEEVVQPCRVWVGVHLGGCVFAYMLVCVLSVFVQVCVCVYVCVFTFVFVCTCVCACVYVRVCGAFVVFGCLLTVTRACVP